MLFDVALKVLVSLYGAADSKVPIVSWSHDKLTNSCRVDR